MQENRVQLVTFIHSEEPFEWGLDLTQVAIPLCVYCPEYFFETLAARPRSVFVEIIAIFQPELPGSFQKVNLLSAVAEANRYQTKQFYWLEVSFLQAYLSFAFLNTNVLADWLSAFDEDLAAFEFPETDAPVLWGGTETKLSALKAHCRVLDDLLFSPETDPGPIASEINNSFRRLRFKDHEPNLEIAHAITEPVLHLIGDEHIFYGFTPLQAIGCRSHVFLESPLASDFFVSFPYRFSHFTDELSIHKAETVLTPDLLQKLQIKTGDLVIFGAGTLDLQCMAATDFYNDAEDAVKNYLARVVFLAATLNFRAAVSEVPPPSDLPDESDEKNGIGLPEKTQRTQQLNTLLQKWSILYGIPVFSIYQELVTASGTLAPGKSDGYKYVLPETGQAILKDFEINFIQKHIKNTILP